MYKNVYTYVLNKPIIIIMGLDKMVGPNYMCCI